MYVTANGDASGSSAGPFSSGPASTASNPSNLAAIAAELAGRDLVERTRDELDRRRYVLRLSPAGEEMLRRTDGAIADAEGDLLAPLDEEQRDQLYGLLRKLADGVELCPAPGDDTCAD